MSESRLAVHEFQYDQKSFWRNPMSVFATIMLPLLYLFIFVTNFGNSVEPVAGQPGKMKLSIYLVATIIAIGIVSANFLDLSVALVQERERGILKRLRSTPLPTWTFIAGRIGNAIVMTVLLTVVLVGLGRLVYGVPIPTARIPALILTLVVGAVAFCCLAFAFTLIVRKDSAAMSMAIGVTLTLFFLSGNFFRVENHSMRTVADIFPVKHLNQALITVFNPHTTGSGIQVWDLIVIALWGAGALLLAARLFRWTPRSD
jgi:ABC-2 type transport system permease protein